MFETFKGVIRHILTFGGGFLASSGIIPESDVDVLVGAVVTLIGIVWSAIDKRSAKDKLDKAIAAPAGEAE